MISIFDIFKIGIGPSSLHTMAPMKAARLAMRCDGVHHVSLDAVIQTMWEASGKVPFWQFQAASTRAITR